MLEHRYVIIAIENTTKIGHDCNFADDQLRSSLSMSRLSFQFFCPSQISQNR